jgi:hypothetical protein
MNLTDPEMKPAQKRVLMTMPGQEISLVWKSGFTYEL